MLERPDSSYMMTYDGYYRDEYKEPDDTSFYACLRGNICLADCDEFWSTKFSFEELKKYLFK